MSSQLRTSSKKCNAAHGFAAIAAIFLIVVLAALGSFMVTFSNTQQLTSAQDVQGTRAYWAARAGSEWAVAKVAAVASPVSLVSSTCTTATPLAVDGFSVEVNCSVSTFMESGDARFVVEVQSMAHTSAGVAGSVGFVERSLSTIVER